MLTAKIHHITRIRINSDGDGVRSVVFVHGCPLDCFWCCNPETRFTDNYKTLTTKQLNEYVIRDEQYFLHSNGGVTFCGGEPLLYVDFIKEYIEKYCKNFSVNVETSLFIEREKIEEIIPFINEWYIDFKIFDENKHIKYTGKSNELIKSNLRFLASKIDPKKIAITFPMITGYNTSESDVLKMSDFLKDIGIYRLVMSPYRKEAEFRHKELNLESVEVPECSVNLFRETEKLLIDEGFEIMQKEVLTGKQKCFYLKNIRRDVCVSNDIKLDIKECFYKGECTGTCPQCEYELSVINEYMSRKCKEMK